MVGWLFGWLLHCVARITPKVSDFYYAYYPLANGQALQADSKYSYTSSQIRWKGNYARSVDMVDFCYVP
jgi:hypothetical protein